MDAPAHQITGLLQAWGKDPTVPDRLLPLVYGDLRRLARRYMAQERPDHTLGTTALVHEACVQLLDSSCPSWQDRAHFMAVCARAMRRILVDWARSRQALKRGGGVPALRLEEVIAVAGQIGRAHL